MVTLMATSSCSGVNPPHLLHRGGHTAVLAAKLYSDLSTGLALVVSAGCVLNLAKGVSVQSSHSESLNDACAEAARCECMLGVGTI